MTKSFGETAEVVLLLTLYSRDSMASVRVSALQNFCEAGLHGGETSGSVQRNPVNPARSGRKQR